MLIYIILGSFFSIKGFGQGITSDTTNYLANGNMDNYKSWSFARQTGATGTLNTFAGLHGDGLKIDYNFPASGGWVNLEIPVGSIFTKNNPLVFFVYSASTAGKLEIKFIDSDGSVFMVKPALSNYSGNWVHVAAYIDNTSYAWGGNSSFGTPAKFSIAVSGENSSSGTVYIDEVGVGKPGLASSFLPTTDPNSELAGVGFAQRRDTIITPEDPLVLAYLENLQDQSTSSGKLVPTYWGGNQAQTFNNCLVALAFITKNEKSRAERILDFYLNATDSTNSTLLKQNFFYQGEARGFFQECDIQTLQAMGAKNRWMGDMAWLLITCKNYQKKYNSNRYEYLIQIIKDLFLSFYKPTNTGGYIQHGWEYGDTQLHENYGHHEGNIDCYVALKLCGEDFIAHQIKTWLDAQLIGNTSLPLDLYTWRTLAFGAFGNAYISLLNIPEYDFRFRKIINVNGNDVMGMYSNPDITINNFWNDGTGHISCAFQAFGDKQRGYFYANQMDALIISQIVGNHLVHGIPYTLNTQGYPGVDPNVAVVSPSAWYILAKNGINPFLSESFIDSIPDIVSNRKLDKISVEVYPNPFSKTVSISFKSGQKADFQINIYSINGAKIKTLKPVLGFGGISKTNWNGTDSKGSEVKSGVYLIQVNSEHQKQISRVLYLKQGN